MSTQTPELEGELLDEPVLRLTGAARAGNGRSSPASCRPANSNGLSSRHDRRALRRPRRRRRQGCSPMAWSTTAGATHRAVVAADRLSRAAFDERRRQLPDGCRRGRVQEGPLRARRRAGRRFLAGVVGAGPRSIRMTATTMAQRSPRSTARFVPSACRAASRLHKSGYDMAVGLVDGKLAFAPTAGQFDAQRRRARRRA